MKVTQIALDELVKCMESDRTLQSMPMGMIVIHRMQGPNSQYVLIDNPAGGCARIELTTS